MDWGQFAAENFKEVAVEMINMAASARSSQTFSKEGRWQTTLAAKSNHVSIQFRHNDSPAPGNPGATDAVTDCKQ